LISTFLIPAAVKKYPAVVEAWTCWSLTCRRYRRAIGTSTVCVHVRISTFNKIFIVKVQCYTECLTVCILSVFAPRPTYSKCYI